VIASNAYLPCTVHLSNKDQAVTDIYLIWAPVMKQGVKHKQRLCNDGSAQELSTQSLYPGGPSILKRRLPRSPHEWHFEAPCPPGPNLINTLTLAARRIATLWLVCDLQIEKNHINPWPHKVNPLFFPLPSSHLEISLPRSPLIQSTSACPTLTSTIPQNHKIHALPLLSGNCYLHLGYC